MKSSLLLLSGCMISDVDLPQRAQETCATEISVLEDACASADVIGEHDNAEVIEAIRALTDCVGYDIKAVCSDPGMFEGPKVLEIGQK